MAEALLNGLTEEQLKEIHALAEEENRTPAELMDSMLKVYRLRRLSGYGKAQSAALGIRPRNQVHADQLATEAVSETRDKARGK